MAAERIEGPTPNGGAYAIARFYRDDDGGADTEVDRQTADRIEITEYSEDGRVLMRTYGRPG